jgi:hypothetical protein
MKRGWARTLALASLLPLTASLGCDALTVRSFAGTVMQFTISNVTAATLQPDQHLELWARTQYNDIVRVNGYTDLTAGKTANGIMIRQAIALTDPCMLDGYYFHNANGNLLTSAASFPSSITADGVTQTPEDQAQQVIDRINQLSDNVTITTGGPLLAIVPFTTSVPPTVPDSATPTERRMACDAYAGDPLAYAGNPYQVTAPLKGTVYGFANFASQVPASSYDGFRIDSPLSLKGVQEIFFTVEGDTVDAMNRGPLFLTSTLTTGGRDVVHFELTHADPTSSVSGTAALLVDLDNDPVQF